MASPANRDYQLSSGICEGRLVQKRGDNRRIKEMLSFASLCSNFFDLTFFAIERLKAAK